MNIVLCFNKNIYLQSIVLMNEICTYNTNVHFYVLNDGSLGEKEKSEISNQLKKYNSVFITYIVGTNEINELINSFNKSNYPLLTYYKLFIHEFLPENIEKVLYLDIDTLVLGNLEDLYNIDLENSLLGACIDDCEFSTKRFNDLNIQKFEDSFSYFNTGVMLLNIKKMHSEKFTALLSDFMKSDENKESIKFSLADQDVFNSLLIGNIKLIPLKYNYQVNFMTDYKKLDVRKKFYPEIVEAIQNPVIVHIYGYEHPWYSNSKNPYTKIWRYFANMYNIKMKYKSSISKETRKSKVLRDIASFFHLCKPFGIEYSNEAIINADKKYEEIKGTYK